MNDKRILYLFTRTPLHVGAGSSVGAIDQPIIRERHTGFPVIPATSLKGTFADEWNTKNGEGRIVRSPEGEWLFGATDANNAFAGALQFSEARLLAFPIRSARGSFAWITCPLLLHRAARDGGFVGEDGALKQAREKLQTLAEPRDDEAMFPTGKLDLDVTKNGQQVKQIVLEEYTFTRTGDDEATKVGAALEKLLADPVWQEIKDRLVILSNGMMSFFAQNACEVAQHVRISDETGTAAGGALFNQENVPSETMFYSVLHAFPGRGERFKAKTPAVALTAFQGKVKDIVFQFGGDASTGLGYCTVLLKAPCWDSQSPQS
jgi:CRISPR-associated protein Cmr4